MRLISNFRDTHRDAHRDAPRVDDRVETWQVRKVGSNVTEIISRS